VTLPTGVPRWYAATANDWNRSVSYDYGWPKPYTYGVYKAFLAGTSPNIRSYTVCAQTVLANPTYDVIVCLTYSLLM
jgi:hypothetical protein